MWWLIVLSWNGRDETLACLRSLEALNDPDVTIVCVDNGSADGSVEAIRAAHPGVVLIENGANLGFSGGNNVGIDAALDAGAQWVVLINNDVRLRAGAIAALRAAAEQHPRAGILSGKLFFGDGSGRIWFAGQRFWPALGYSGRPRGYGRTDAPRYRRPGPTDRAAGAFMAVSSTAIERAGKLDEALFAYVEDVDWSLRVRDAGFDVRFVPDAVADHDVSASTGGERGSTHALYYGVRNTIAVSEHHLPLPAPLTQVRRWFIYAVFMAQALLLSEGRSRFVAAVRDGYHDVRVGRFGERGAARETRGSGGATGRASEGGE